MKEDYFSIHFTDGEVIHITDGEVWYARFDTENEGPYGLCKLCPCVVFTMSNSTVFVVPLGLLKKQVRANFKLDAVKPNPINGLNERRVMLYGCAQVIDIELLEGKCGKIDTETMNIVNAGIIEHILFKLEN